MPKDITGCPVLTAEDLDRMTPEERQAEYVAQLQARAAALAAQREAVEASDQDVPHAS